MAMSGAVSNVINQIVFGHRLDYNNPNLEGIQQHETCFPTAAKSNALPLYKVSYALDFAVCRKTPYTALYREW